jgi:hypothetical protein
MSFISNANGVINMNATIADFPAYRIYKAYDGRKFKHGDVIAVPYDSRSHGQLYRFYTLGTVEGYAIANGECPIEALKRHYEMAAKFPYHGHNRYWANQNNVCIHNGPVVKVEVPGFELGQQIILQGKIFTIEAAPNGNIKLVEA